MNEHVTVKDLLRSIVSIECNLFLATVPNCCRHHLILWRFRESARLRLIEAVRIRNGVLLREYRRETQHHPRRRREGGPAGKLSFMRGSAAVNGDAVEHQAFKLRF